MRSRDESSVACLKKGRVQMGEERASVASPEVSLHDHGLVLDLLRDNLLGVVLNVGDKVLIRVVCDNDLDGAK